MIKNLDELKAKALAFFEDELYGQCDCELLDFLEMKESLPLKYLIAAKLYKKEEGKKANIPSFFMGFLAASALFCTQWNNLKKRQQ